MGVVRASGGRDCCACAERSSRGSVRFCRRSSRIPARGARRLSTAPSKPRRSRTRRACWLCDAKARAAGPGSETTAFFGPPSGPSRKRNRRRPRGRPASSPDIDTALPSSRPPRRTRQRARGLRPPKDPRLGPRAVGADETRTLGRGSRRTKVARDERPRSSFRPSVASVRGSAARVALAPKPGRRFSSPAGPEPIAAPR
mmetsp:Transcript_13987/g.43354  ORF Transcript_13987/g.43354 Transcript_13987/m.43354 type:complete len:200 (+) Transcript_13987:200-799(+)